MCGERFSLGDALGTDPPTISEGSDDSVLEGDRNEESFEGFSQARKTMTEGSDDTTGDRMNTSNDESFAGKK